MFLLFSAGSAVEDEPVAAWPTPHVVVGPTLGGAVVFPV